MHKATTHIIRTIVPAAAPNQVATVQCRINTAEGYVLKLMPDVPVQYGNTNSQYGFFYETRDHLGNIISVWDAGHQWLTQQTTYWPSGMPFTWRGEQHVTEQLISIIARDINLYTTTIDLHGVYGVLMV